MHQVLWKNRSQHHLNMTTERVVFKPEIVEDSKSDDKEDASLLLSLEKLSIKPKKKILLVLAIGGLIFDRVHFKNKYGAPKNRSPDFVSGNFRIYKRPFCEEFLEFCLERFEVGLWSSAQERNVDGVLSKIKPGLKSKLLFIWDQEECTESDYEVENSDKPIFLKELKKIWENNAKWENGPYSSSNTLLIDNDSYKGILNPPYTAIFPPKYKANMFKDKFLSPKGELQTYLEGLADSNDDVPSYVKKHPFGEEQMTSSHPSWSYYSKVVTEFTNDQEDEASTSTTNLDT